MSNNVFKSVFFTGLSGYLGYVGVQQASFFTNPLSTAGRVATVVAPLLSAKILGFTPTVARKIVPEKEQSGSRLFVYAFSIVATTVVNSAITAAIATYEQYGRDDIELFSLRSAMNGVLISLFILSVEHIIHRRIQNMDKKHVENISLIGNQDFQFQVNET